MGVLYGACIEYLRQFFHGDFSVFDGTTTVGVAAVNVAHGDAERVSVTFVNLGATNIYLAPSTEVSVTRGIRLAATGGTVSMNVFQDSLLPALEWWAIGDGGGGSLYVLSVRRDTIVEE